MDYFSQTLAHSQGREVPNLKKLIMLIIFKNGNAQLLKIMHLEEEIKEAIKSIMVDSSLGPYGFVLGFYMTCWDFILEDLREVVQEFFFNEASLSKFFTAPYIVLIPKVDTPTSFEKFHPISLCMVAYKIMSKLIVN